MLEGPMLETLDYTIRIGSIPTFLYFDLYLHSAYAAHFVYNLKVSKTQKSSISILILFRSTFKIKKNSLLDCPTIGQFLILYQRYFGF